MDKEKILSYIDIDVKGPIDKFSMKLFTGFYIGFSVFVFGFSVLLRLIPFSFIHLSISILSVFSLILQLLSIRFCKNHAYEWLHHAFALFCSILVLLYGWFVFSKGELSDFGYPRFGWMHLAVLFAALVLGGYMISKFYWVYKVTMNSTIEEAQAILQSKNRTNLSVPLVLAGSPMVFVRMLRGPFADMGLGAGFAAWTLMCCWLVLGMMLLPKIVVILKYKVYRWI